MDSLIKTIERNGLTLEVHYDAFPIDPREYDAVGQLALKHPRYYLANETDIHIDSIDNIQQLFDEIRRRYNVRMITGVQLYDHGGVELTLCSPDDYIGNWDTVMAGIMFIDSDNDVIKDNPEYTDEELRQILKDQLKWYSQYLNGEVYSYIVKDSDDNVIDSCAGFFDMDEMIEDIDWDWCAKESHRIKNDVPTEQLEINF